MWWLSSSSTEGLLAQLASRAASGGCLGAVAAHTCHSLTSSQCPSSWPHHGAQARACSRMGASPTWRPTWACQTQSPVPVISCRRCPSPLCSCPWLLWGYRHAGNAQLPSPGSCDPVTCPARVPVAPFVELTPISPSVPTCPCLVLHWHACTLLASQTSWTATRSQWKSQSQWSWAASTCGWRKLTLCKAMK